MKANAWISSNSWEITLLGLVQQRTNLFWSLCFPLLSWYAGKSLSTKSIYNIFLRQAAWLPEKTHLSSNEKNKEASKHPPPLQPSQQTTNPPQNQTNNKKQT